jgi:single-strand DNA-binding protein
MKMINKVCLLGRLGRDAECENKEKPIRFSVATWENYRDEEEESGWKTITTWHNITLWGKPDSKKYMLDFLKKGAVVYLEGKIKNNKWTGDNGEEKRSNDIVATFVKKVPAVNSLPSDKEIPQANAKPKPKPEVEEEDEDVDLPF